MKSNRFANLYLVLLIIFISIRFILIGVFQLNMDLHYLETPSPLKTLMLLSFPCFYLYFKSLVSDSQNFDRSSLYHFILPLLLFIWNGVELMSTSSISEHTVTLNYILACGLVIYYLQASFSLMRAKLWKKRNNMRFQNYFLIRNWTIFLFSICVLLSIRLLSSLTYEILNDTALTGGKYAFVIGSGAWLLIFVKLLVSPEILHGLPKLKKIVQLVDGKEITRNGNWKPGAARNVNIQDLRLKAKMDEKRVQLIADLERFSENERIFKQAKLTIKDVAVLMKIPTSHLVYLFKYHSNLTFVEYKTLQRILHSIELIQNGYLEMNTLESLAGEVGFASYNPFFSAFKKHTGLSPVDYSLKIE